MSKTPLAPYEVATLKEFAGINPATLNGAAKNAAIECLRSRRFLDSKGLITFAGRQYLRDDGYICPEPSESRDLTFAEVTKINLKRCEAADGFNHSINGWSLGDWMVGLTGEVGEAANIVKKMNCA